MRNYVAVFAKCDDMKSDGRFKTTLITAKDHNDMVRQSRELKCPNGYYYIGTRDDNNWHYQPKV